MKKYIYSQHDERANFYNHPQISEIEPKAFAENIKRSIMLCRDPKQLAMLADCKLCFLGTFDDNEAIFDILEKPEVIVEVDKLIESTGFVNEHSDIKS